MGALAGDGETDVDGRNKIKSRSCGLCGKTKAPSVFDQCVLCEPGTCGDEVIKKKCIKGPEGTLNIIARLKGAVDTDGKANFTLRQAGFADGQLQMFLQRLEKGMVLGGLVGYIDYELEDRTTLCLYQYVCAGCAQERPDMTPAQVSKDTVSLDSEDSDD